MPVTTGVAFDVPEKSPSPDTVVAPYADGYESPTPEMSAGLPWPENDPRLAGSTAPTVTIQSGPGCDERSVLLGTKNDLSWPLCAAKNTVWPRSVARRWASVFEPV